MPAQTSAPASLLASAVVVASGAPASANWMSPLPTIALHAAPNTIAPNAAAASRAGARIRVPLTSPCSREHGAGTRGSDRGGDAERRRRRARAGRDEPEHRAAGDQGAAEE